MSIFVVLAFILSFCYEGFAAESRGYYRHPDYPGKCVYKELILSPGEKAKLPKTCARILCGNDSFAVIQTCGSRIAPHGCKYTDYINIDAPYSECCKRKLEC